jgi:hypothetical protein
MIDTNMTQAARVDRDYYSQYGFSYIGQFPESKIEGIIGDVSMEEGGDFETHGAFKDDGNTSKRGWLRLYHRPKYSEKSGRPD